MLKIGITGLSDIEISELFDQFNPNKDGLLDYKEFVSIYSNKSISIKKEKPKTTNWGTIPNPHSWNKRNSEKFK